MNEQQVITETRQSYADMPHIHIQSSRYHFFFGDASALDLYAVLKDEVEWYHHQYIGVLELPQHMLHMPEQKGLLLDVVPTGGRPAARAIAYLRNLEAELWALWKKGVFYLSGKEAAVNQFEKALHHMEVLPAQIMRI